MEDHEKKAHVPEALHHLREVLDSVMNQTEKLEKRLLPVMHGSVVKENAPRTEPQPIAPLATELRSFYDILSKADEMLRQIHSRLQL